MFVLSVILVSPAATSSLALIEGGGGYRYAEEDFNKVDFEKVGRITGT